MRFLYPSSYLAAFTTGLMAGLLFAFSVSVNPGLQALPDREYLAAMQEINRAIQNPVFIPVFLAPLLLLPLSAWRASRSGARLPARLFLAAAIAYWVGMMAVTVAGNIPLNESLDGLNLKALNAEALNRQRRRFEGPWIRWHTVRTAFAAVSFVLALGGLTVRKPAGRGR